MGIKVNRNLSINIAQGCSLNACILDEPSNVNNARKHAKGNSKASNITLRYLSFLCNIFVNIGLILCLLFQRNTRLSLIKSLFTFESVIPLKYKYTFLKSIWIVFSKQNMIVVGNKESLSLIWRNAFFRWRRGFLELHKGIACRVFLCSAINSVFLLCSI